MTKQGVKRRKVPRKEKKKQKQTQTRLNEMKEMKE